MNLASYKDKRVTIKANDAQGTIKDVKPRRGSDGSLGARFIVVTDDNNEYELRPDEIKIHV